MIRESRKICELLMILESKICCIAQPAWSRDREINKPSTEVRSIIRYPSSILYSCCYSFCSRSRSRFGLSEYIPLRHDLNSGDLRLRTREDSINMVDSVRLPCYPSHRSGHQRFADLTGFFDSFPLKNFAPGQADDSPG